MSNSDGERSEVVGRRVVPLRVPTSVGGLDLLVGVPVVWGLEILGILIVMGVFGVKPTPGSVVMGGLWSGVMTVGVAWFFVCGRHGKSFGEGFRIFWDGWRRALVGVGVGLVGAVVGTVVMSEFSTGESLMSELTSTWEGMVSVSVVAVLLPMVEELYYRGFILTGLKKVLEDWNVRGSGWIVGGVVAGWFGLVHVAQLWGDPAAIPVVATMGLIWTAMRVKWGALLPSMISHQVYNTTLILMSLLTFEQSAS